MLGPARGALRRLNSSVLARVAQQTLPEANGEQQQLACFHTGPSMRRAASPWQRQAKAQLTSSSSTASQAAVAAWTATPVTLECQQVEDWLLNLQVVDATSREVCQNLLRRHPGLLYVDPVRVTATVQVLMDATRQKQLLRPWFMQDAQILAIIDRYTPETLRARLAELHRCVWEELDNTDVGSLFAKRSSLDLLDLEARSLARKAQTLRKLVPEFLPSTVLRSCPELLDMNAEELPRHIHHAGDVVVIGTGVRAEFDPLNNTVVISSAPHAGIRMPLLASRLMAAAAVMPAPPVMPQVVRVLSNTRRLVYADAAAADVRYEDPYKTEEELSAAGQLSFLPRLCKVAAAAQASAAVHA